MSEVSQMRCPQLLVLEKSGRVAALLRELAATEGWALHVLRKPGTGQSLLRRGGPAVLVVRAGRDVEREMTLVEHVAWRYPDTATVVVCDADNYMLAGLAWDLGASCVLTPAQLEEHLKDVVAGLMHSAAELQPRL